MRWDNMLPKLLCVLFSVTLLSSCSLLSPVKSRAQSAYIINAVPTPETHRTHHVTLLISTPETSAAYNTTMMAYTTRPYQIAYFSQNQWAETPAQMLQPLLVQAMQETHYFHAVVTLPFSGHYDYVLNTQILRLQQDFTHRHPCLQLSVRMQLTNATTSQVLATRQYTIDEPLRYASPYSGVMAANRAMERLLRQIAAFSIANVSRL